MKIKNLFLLFFAFLSFNLSAQEWNSLAPNILHAENGANNVSPIFVGIGTANPQNTLHTSGFIRFQNLPFSNDVVSILGTTAGGLVFRVDPESLGNSNDNSWLLTGNNGVTNNNFIGTINNQDFRIRTNNVQKMVVTTGGNVGISSTITTPFHTPAKLIDARFSDPTNYIPSADALDGILLYNLDTTPGTVNNGASLTFAARGPGNSATDTDQAKATISGVVSGANAMDLVFQNEFTDPAVMRESMRITSAGRVGIGTNTPTAQLHTTDSIRFQNLPSADNVVSLLGTMANGDVREVDPSSLDSNNAWELTGNNNVTNANFIGSTNNQDFRIRTNNDQKMVVTTSGNIGVSSIPTAQQDFHDPEKLIDARFAEGATYLPETDALDGILLYNRNINQGGDNQGTSITFAAIDSENSQSKATISGVVSSNGRNGMDLVFQNEHENPGVMRESMRITNNGFVGIGTNAPEVQLHTTGEVQFDGLPAGGGCFLALDASNRVVVTNACTAGGGQVGSFTIPEDLQQEITELEVRIAKLEAFINEHMAVKDAGSYDLPSTSKAVLHQNVPNPFNEETKIKFFIPDFVSFASLNITDINGKVIKTISIQDRGNAEVEIFNTDFSTGVYFYSLIVDGEIIGTKKMNTTAK